jgi:hypothetical protein
LLNGLLARFGGKRIWDEALATLKYPPTWITEIEERDRLAKALDGRKD